MSGAARQRVVVATTLWKRPALTQIVLAHYRHLQQQLSARVELILMAVGSEGHASRELCERHGFDYIETDNEPVTYKWNAVIRRAQPCNPDLVIVVNSDDIFSANLVEAYLHQVDAGVDYFGLRDTYIFDIQTQTRGRWPGYDHSFMQFRVGEPAGCARGFSRRLLESTNWRLWPPMPPRNSMMDFWCTQFVKLFGFEPVALTMAELGVTAVQLKTDVNITPFNVLPLQDIEMGAAAWHTVSGVLEPRELEALHALHNVMAPDSHVHSPLPSVAIPDHYPDADTPRIYRVEDLEPRPLREQILGDLIRMRDAVANERLVGAFDQGVAVRVS